MMLDAKFEIGRWENLMTASVLVVVASDGSVLQNECLEERTDRVVYLRH